MTDDTFPPYSRVVAPRLPSRHAGRDRELRLASHLVNDLTSGQGAVLLIEGEAGIGKTWLVRSLIDDARSAGVIIHRGEAHPFERTRPFGVVADALDLRRHSADSARAQVGRLLTGDVKQSETPGALPDLRHRVVEEIIELVEVECAQAPVLVVLEDLHWADTSTLLALRSMARRLVHVPLLLVGSLRPAPRSSELDLLLAEALRWNAHAVRLEPLEPDEVDALARQELGLPLGPTLRAVLAKAGGNPLWVVEIIRSLSAQGQLRRDPNVVDVTTSELPDSLRELVVRRLRYLPETTLDLLQITAVLGDAVSINDLAAVARRPATELIAGLREAFHAALLGEQGDGVVFRHQLVHDAIYHDMPLPVRRALHRDAAGALARSGAEVLQIADHLVLGAVRGDLEAVRWLRAAAREAAPGAPSVTVELLRRAESMLPGGHPDADLIAAELVEALLRTGDVAEAAARAEAVLDRRHRSEADAPLRLSLVSALSLQNRPAELIQRAEAALMEVHSLPLADQSLLLAQASYGRTFSGDIVGGEATARRALELAERCGDAAMTVWSLTTMSVAVKSQGRYGEALALTRRAVARAFEPPNADTRLRHPLFFLGLALCDSDLAAEARDAYDKALDECDVLHSTWLLPDTILMSAEARFLLGEWDDAKADLEAGMQMAQERGQRILVGQSRAYQAIIAEARGDLQSARETLRLVEAELEADPPRYGAEMVAYAAALIAEADGDLSTAYRLLLRFWDHDFGHENRYYHRYFAPALVRLALALDERSVARRVSDVANAGAALALEVPSVQSAAHRCRGLVDDDPDAMLAAVDFARQSLRVLDRGGACEDAANVLVDVGRATEAKALLAEALACYEDVDARAWAARTGAALRRLGVHRGTRGPRRRPTSGWESLTASERDVSRLVAEGLTNREVAKRLHVSPHTVNTHLRHVFEKLSVSNRAALAATVARFSEPAT